MPPAETKEPFDREAFRGTFMDLRDKIPPLAFDSTDTRPWERPDADQRTLILDLGRLVATTWGTLDTDNDRCALAADMHAGAHAGLFDRVGKLALETIVAAAEEVLREGYAPTTETGELDRATLETRLVSLLRSAEVSFGLRPPLPEDRRIPNRLIGAEIVGYMADAMIRQEDPTPLLDKALATVFPGALEAEQILRRALIANAALRGVATVLANKLLAGKPKQALERQQRLLEQLPTEFTDDDLRRVIEGDQRGDPVGFTCLESVVAIALDMDSEGTLRARYDRLMEENERRGPFTTKKMFEIFSTLAPEQQKHIRKALVFLCPMVIGDAAALLETSSERPEDVAAFINGTHRKQEIVMEIMKEAVKQNPRVKRLPDLLALYLYDLYREVLRDDSHITAAERRVQYAGYQGAMRALQEDFTSLFDWKEFERAIRDIIWREGQSREDTL